MDIFATFKESFAENHVFLPMLLSLIGGFLTALSPCVYPIIPVTIVVMGAHRTGSRWKNLAIAATYVGGMVLLYTTLSVVFTSLGLLAGSLFQHPGFMFVVGALFIFMGASLFGVFKLVVPPKVLTWLGKVGGAGFSGAFLMGLVSGLIAAPCTGPVLGFLLTLIAKDGVYSRGIFCMVFFALGMGIPFMLLGAFSQAIGSLPKSGRFMTVARMLLGTAIIASGLYYIYLGYNCAGGSCVARLASTDGGNGDGNSNGGKWIEVGSSEQALRRFDVLLAEAKRQGKPVVIDFFARWCVACKALEKTLSRAPVRFELDRFIAIRVDATANSKALVTLQQRLGVVGLPTVVFVSSTGELLPERMLVGIVDLESVLSALAAVH